MCLLDLDLKVFCPVHCDVELCVCICEAQPVYSCWTWCLYGSWTSVFLLNVVFVFVWKFSLCVCVKLGVCMEALPVCSCWTCLCLCSYGTSSYVSMFNLVCVCVGVEALPACSCWTWCLYGSSASVFMLNLVFVWKLCQCVHVELGVCMEAASVFMLNLVFVWKLYQCVHVELGVCMEAASVFMLNLVFVWKLYQCVHVELGVCVEALPLRSCWTLCVYGRSATVFVLNVDWKHNLHFAFSKSVQQTHCQYHANAASLPRIWYKINTVCYKCVTHTAPAYLCDCLQLYTHSHTLHSASNTLSLQIPHIRLHCWFPRFLCLRSVNMAFPFLSDRNPLWTHSDVT